MPHHWDQQQHRLLRTYSDPLTKEPEGAHWRGINCISSPIPIPVVSSLNSLCFGVSQNHAPFDHLFMN